MEPTNPIVQFFQTRPAPVENISEAMWLIIAFPLVGALLSGLFGRMLGRANTGLIASAAVAGSFIVSVLVHWTLNDPKVILLSMHGGEFVRQAISHDYGTWFSVGDFSVKFGLWADHLTSTMLLVITGVGLLIHIYSTSYMSHDAGYWRYFAYLNLFVAMMLTLVLADNLVLLFVGWEGVGLCSYLLIGFWYTDPAKAWAGRKAFITNRIGDFAFIVAMCLLVVLTVAFAKQSSPANFGRSGKAAYEQGLSQTGPLNFQSIEALSRGVGAPGQGVRMGMDTIIQDGPLKGFTVDGVITFILLLFLLGAAGKSAQLPLYVWLPDAMAGPTPVSALIHAATMVTAGVYLFSRLSFLLVLSPLAMTVIAVIGTLTALIAALIAFAQDDIKKVLAYSTVSQLGIMFMGVGFGVFWAAVFHLVTHAFFKACLFLGAGSVMHGNADETDIKKLGGLRKEMPFTHWTFAISWAAITGIVPLSGFFSKDAILHGIHATTLGQYAWATNLVYYLGLLVALCTAFYMTRLYLLTFWGKRSPEAKIAHAHESDFAMTVPLMILSGLAIVAAAFYLVPLPTRSGQSQPLMENFLAPVFNTATRLANGRVTVEHGEAGFSAYLIAWIIVAIGGAAAWFAYTRFFPSWRAAGKPVPGFARAARGFAVAKFYVDELYEAVLLRPIKWIAKMLYQLVDALLIDTIAVRGTGWVVTRLGAFFRYSQTGDVQRYAAVMAIALVIGVAYVIFAL